METINKIQKIREDIREFKEKEQLVLRPILTDEDYLPFIFDWYSNLVDSYKPELKARTTLYRQRFTFIVMLLYSPGSLVGDNLKRGLREKLSKLFIISETNVSHNLKNVLFFYNQYNDFREDVNYLYSEIMRLLEENGLIENREV